MPRTLSRWSRLEQLSKVLSRNPEHYSDLTEAVGIVVITQEAYDALDPPNATTLYVIVE